MKTTIEIPDSVYRQVKARTALRGETVKSFLLSAIKEKLAAERGVKKVRRGWRSVFGKAKKSDVVELQQIIDEEFSGIDPQDWQ